MDQLRPRAADGERVCVCGLMVRLLILHHARMRKRDMAVPKRRYPKEEFARRGEALFESKVRPNLKPGDENKFVAIDIETGEYEIHRNEMTAGDRLRKRLPEAQI